MSAVTRTKPIRPTTARMSESEARAFDAYARKSEPTQSVSMNEMRKMMAQFQAKRV